MSALCVLWMLPTEPLKPLVFLLRRRHRGIESILFFSPAPKFSACRFFSLLFLSHLSFLKARPFGSFPQSFRWASSVSPSVTIFLPGSPSDSVSPDVQASGCRYPPLLSSPAQPTYVSFKQVQALPGRSWFQDSSIGLSRVLLSGWPRHFFVRNNLDLFSTFQILSLSFTFGTRFHQALKPGFIQ